MAASTSRIRQNEQHEVRNVNVFLRVRPMNDRERANRSHEAVEVSSNREVVVKQDNRMTKKFTFDRSFGQDSNQVAVYQSVVAPYIEEVLAGYNCTVFAYGQTGTGKTHTMIGEECPDATNSWDAMSQVGIIPRAVSHLFEELRIMGVEFSMRISFLELYNEELTDLLSTADQTPIRIYDDNSKKGSIIVHGLEELPVHSSADVYKLLAKGQEKRKTASTLMNIQSSRSHTIFSILVHIRENNSDGEEVLKVGKLNLVDLAGSENIGKAGNEKGIRTRETVNINQSLLTLGRVITALVERTPHIPYRESKLTRLLQESLGGRTKTSIIATISPGHRDLEETLSTLEYAHRAKNIQNKPEVNQKLTKKLALKEYSEEIERLKRDLMASRSKNGIYLAEETFDEMNCRIEAQNKELSEKQMTIKVLKDEVAKVQKVFNEVSLNLVQRETELAETYDNLHSTKAELVHTSKVLRNTNRRYQEKREIVASHVHTEQVLTSQAQQLKNAADTASQDTYLLHDTIERRKQTDRNIVSVSENFEKSMNTNISDMTTDVDNFHSQIENQSKSFVEYIETSMTRNSNQFATILEKLAEQRSATELNACDVKKLLAEKMTGDVSCTAEQVELIQSIFSQVIADERKMSDTLTNVMLKSLLSSLDAQNARSLESHTAMLDMINAQRDLITNFSTNLITRLENLSADGTGLLTSCRNSVDSAVASNKLLIGNMAKFLDDLKSNTDSMETISPTISQTMDTLTSVVKTQIDETTNMKGEHEKRSDEQMIKVTSIADEQKKDFAATGNDISKMTASITNHTKLFAAAMKSSKVKIIEHFDRQKSMAAAALANIDSKISDGIERMKSTTQDISGIVNEADQNLKLDSQANLNFKQTVTTFVHSFGASSKKKFDTLRTIVHNFHGNDLKVYSSSGETPAKRDFSYPKVLAATSPHDRIVRRFWSTHNESELDVSMSISEENETAFMNGVNEIASSSLVQQRNGLMMSSPIGRASLMEEERIVTILERDGDDEEEQPFVEASESIPNRVLSEMTVVIANTQSTPVCVSKQPIGNALRPNDIADVEVPPIDADTTIGSSDSNKEN
ncbi:hypothetical protein HA402_012866 [Bradysia odoriphaga]|nr:hypothetical protein HA402_012866 [Bradysia odoriphaga]